jgi:PIN domain nuclease of toxin-antitoxin system
MNLLLDTHVLIWLVEGSENLSQLAKQAIEDEQNSLYLSIASLWEMTPASIEILPINLNHLLVLRDLPLHHRDPFDRILISQAQAEELTLVSGDRLFSNYLVQTLW